MVLNVDPSKLTIAQLTAEINRICGTSLKPTAFKTKALALARYHKVLGQNPVTKSALPRTCPSSSDTCLYVPLVATPDEVRELQSIRDKRLAGLPYKGEKLAFFHRFRDKYGIDVPCRIKIETEDPARLGLVQRCDNDAYIMVRAAS